MPAFSKRSCSRLRATAYHLKASLTSLRLHFIALLYRVSLPPGSFTPLSEEESKNPRFLLDRKKIYGPVFKVFLDGKMTTCVIGLPLGRRFLADHESSSRAATTDLRPLFPFGTLRQMTGEAHRRYRRIFIEAFKNTRIDSHKVAVSQALDELVQQLASTKGTRNFETVRSLFKMYLTKIFLLLIFGIDRSSNNLEELILLFDRYAPNGTVITVQREHAEAYAEIRALILKHAEALRPEESSSSLLGRLVSDGMLDETAVGNLIQMTEAGRFDVMGLWAWLIKLLGDNQECLSQLAVTSPNSVSRERFSRALVLEALRLEQSEFVLRVATSNIVFERFLIPKRSRVRIAVWESHKDHVNFDKPFEFNPLRFLEKRPGPEAYSPFGMDQHLCLGADWVVSLSAMFVERLGDSLRWNWEGSQKVGQGVFHFQPDGESKIRFRKWSA